jgi:hypothetical protein
MVKCITVLGGCQIECFVVNFRMLSNVSVPGGDTEWRQDTTNIRE